MNLKKDLENVQKFNAPLDWFLNGGVRNNADIAQGMRNKAEYLTQPEVLGRIYNANTIDPGLKRSAIIQDLIRDFARRLLPLSALSTVFRDVPLEGNNKVSVPYFGLDTSASTSFVSGTGYTTIGDTNSGMRDIEVGEAASNNQGNRLYQALQFSSSEIARQPALKVKELAAQKIDKLAADIMANILSVFTAANFGAPGLVSSPDMFDADDVATLKLACKLWNEDQRSLILSSEFDAQLLKDPSFRSAMEAGSDRAIKEGKLFPRVMGFNYIENPTIPSNGENLVGMAVHASAALVAFAPVPPIEEVRNAGTRYEMFIEPKSGIVLEYRSFGNPVLDAATHVIESNFGWAKGNGNACKRVVSA